MKKGLYKQEYIELLKECSMCTKKWTYAKWKQFDTKRKEIIQNGLNRGSDRYIFYFCGSRYFQQDAM